MAVRRLHGGLYTTVRQLTGMINDLAALANELKTELNAVTTKLDADAGVTDTNYNSLHVVGASDSDTARFADGTPT